MRLSAVAFVFASLTALAACSDPCKELEQKVCEDPKYLKANKKHCDLITDPERRDSLTKDVCKNILDFLSKR